MVALAAREAAAHKLANMSFSVGDITALPFGDGDFDAAVTRFSLHHIPVPARVLSELGRVVRPGGRIVICDSVADEDVEAFAVSQEIERLRDPSHWASLTRGGLHAAGEAAGLRLESEELVEIEIDFDDWLARGSGRDNAPLIERALANAPPGMRHFAVRSAPGGRVIDYRIALTRWRR
jgi:SAM-dependent methyltransferase